MSGTKRQRFIRVPFTLGQCVMSIRDEGDLKVQNDRMPEVDLSSSSITPQEKKKLEKLLYDFRGLFISKGGPLGRTWVVNHAIKMTGPPIREPLQRIPHSLQNQVATEVKRMMEGGVIKQSNSPLSSPVVMVRKRDGSWRFFLFCFFLTEKLMRSHRKMRIPSHVLTRC